MTRMVSYLRPIFPRTRGAHWNPGRKIAIASFQQATLRFPSRVTASVGAIRVPILADHRYHSSNAATATTTFPNDHHHNTGHDSHDGRDHAPVSRKAPTPNTPTDSLNPIPKFDRYDLAYQSKTTSQLLRSWLSFSLCRIPFLVQHSETLLKLSRRMLGDTLVDGILRATLYGHFCAGENVEQIQPVVHTMKDNGIGSILDFAAEADSETDLFPSWSGWTWSSSSSSAPAGTVSIPHQSKEEELAEMVLAQNHPNVRVYNYTNEVGCDHHVETFRSCIRDVAAVQEGGYTAMKVTALVDPKLLARFSRVIAEVQNLFVKFDLDQDGVVSREEFEFGVKAFFRDDDTSMMRLLDELDLENSGGMIDYLSWSMLIKPKDIPQITQSCRDVGPLSLTTPSPDELAMMDRLYDRLHLVANEAAELGVRLLIDAEQCLYQPAIDNLVLDLQREYNDTSKVDYPVVYNTYQCYLKDSSQRLKQDVERSERLKHHFGAKMVRGAYMESERRLAERLGYPSPIHDTIEDTHASYDENIRYLLEKSKQTSNSIEIMVASHNQDSIQRAVAIMNELGIDRTGSTICFAQLYGMMDHVTYGLGRNQYRAFKYVPYGEVKLAIPYLIRRAKENSSVAGGASREIGLIQSELKRRIFGNR